MKNTINDSRVSPCPTTGCWLWIGYTYRNGYGQTHYNHVRSLAHRVYYTTHKGEIPKGLVVDHVCKVRSCVNPDHLRLVTPRENTVLNSEGEAAKNAKKAECPKCGGAYSQPTPTVPSRRCVPCYRTYQSERSKRRYGMSKPRPVAMGQEAE
jgi:hypothetical protein